MGMVYAEITIKNATDAVCARRGQVQEADIRMATVEAIADTGAATLVINEELCKKLGLEVKGTREATLADGEKKVVKIVEPVEVHWKNRSMVCQPLVASNTGKILLGAIPLEDMDLMVDPVEQELTGKHGEEIVSILCLMQKKPLRP